MFVADTSIIDKGIKRRNKGLFARSSKMFAFASFPKFESIYKSARTIIRIVRKHHKPTNKDHE
ncbi:hypothetical protein GCM10020370_59030 [Paenibacillus hodogayensis]